MSDTQQLIWNFDISVHCLGLLRPGMCASFSNSLSFVLYFFGRKFSLKDENTVAGAPRRAAGESNFPISLNISLYYGDKLFQFVADHDPPPAFNRRPTHFKCLTHPEASNQLRRRLQPIGRDHVTGEHLAKKWPVINELVVVAFILTPLSLSVERELTHENTTSALRPRSIGIY
jgi:hypothetical protein